MRGRLVGPAWLLVLGMAGLALAAPMARVHASARGMAPEAPGPALRFRVYEPAHGLPGGSVQALAQDHDGVMWFAVGADLVRFDGVTFQTVRPGDDDAAVAPDGAPQRLVVDQAGRIWLAGEGSGLARYDPVRGQVVRWRHQATEPRSLASDKVWDVAQTPDGAVWVATDAGLDRLLADGAHFEHVDQPLARGGAAGFGRVRALLATADGALWIGTRHGLFVRTPAGAVREVKAAQRSIHGVRRLQGELGDVRAALDGGLLRVGAGGAVGPSAELALEITASARDGRGRIWLATRGGLYLDSGPRLVDVSGGQPLHGGLPGRDVRDVLRDHEGGLWFALGDGGIAYLAPGWDEIVRYSHVAGDATSLRQRAATAVLAGAGGQLWVGGRGVVDRLDPRSGRALHVLSGLGGDVLDLAEDARGRLWVVTRDAVYRLGAGRLARVPLDGAAVTRPWRVAPGPGDTMILVALHEGVFRIDADTLEIARPPLAPAGESGLLATRQGAAGGPGWYAYDGRLLRWDAPRARFLPAVGFTHGVRIAALAPAPDGLWLARGGVLEHYREDAAGLGLAQSVWIPAEVQSSALLALHHGDDGRLWLFTRRAAWRLDPRSGRLTRIGLRDGQVDGELRGDAAARDAGGVLYVAGLGGVSAFHADGAADDASPSPLTLTASRVSGHGPLRALPIRAGLLDVGWADRALHLTARLHSYVDPTANRYRYRLRGVDRDWVDAGASGIREYAGLSAGDYLLDIAAVGADGRANAPFEPVRIHVRPPPWTVWEAQILYACCALLLAMLGLRVRRRRRLAREHVLALEQERRLADAANAAKTSFLAMLSHEIRTPLTGLMGMTELLQTTPLAEAQHDYVHAIERSGIMLMRLLNDALDLARIEAGRLELEPVAFDPHALLRETLELERGLAKLKRIDLALDVAADFPRRVVGDPTRIKQVLLNLINNALKFTAQGGVVVAARRSADGLCFSVRDTGPGIPDASRAQLFERFQQAPGPQRAAGSGLGLAICRELVGLMGGSIALEARSGVTGAAFRVALPLPIALDPPGLPSPPPEGAVRLLLVAADDAAAEIMPVVRDACRYQVSRARHGLDALAALTAAEFDAVLLDLTLPGLDGVQVARLIRTRAPAAGSLPIIALARRAADAGAAALAEAGLRGPWCPPFDVDELAVLLAPLAGASG